MFLIFGIAVPALAGFLAWRNARTGRGDRRGAFKLAAFSFASILLSNLAARHHVPTFAELTVLSSGVSVGFLVAAIFWVLYMAFEPQVRRRSPNALISWSRLLKGRWRDPVVGADLLIGLSISTVVMCALYSFLSVSFCAGAGPAADVLGKWMASAMVLASDCCCWRIAEFHVHHQLTVPRLGLRVIARYAPCTASSALSRAWLYSASFDCLVREVGGSSWFSRSCSLPLKLW
jgi:hypothetical protein